MFFVSYKTVIVFFGIFIDSVLTSVAWCVFIWLREIILLLSPSLLLNYKEGWSRESRFRDSKIPEFFESPRKSYLIPC